MFKEMLVPEEKKKKNIIKELLEFCDKKEEEGELGITRFSEPVDEEEIIGWEKVNGITIPESYKQWLRFSGDCQIDGTTAEFYSPKKFRMDLVPEDGVIIGEEVGDGQVLCFSKETGEFADFYEGKIGLKYPTFYEAIKEVLRMMGKREADPNAEESEKDRLKRLIVNVKSNLDGSDRDKRRLEMIKEMEAELASMEG